MDERLNLELKWTVVAATWFLMGGAVAYWFVQTNLMPGNGVLVAAFPRFLGFLLTWMTVLTLAFLGLVWAEYLVRKRFSRNGSV